MAHTTVSVATHSMEHSTIRGFIRSLAHRERAEVGATVRDSGTTTEIRYVSALAWPWPRQFAYTREFFSQGSASESLEALRNAIATTEEHVVNFFSSELDSETAKFIEAGYVQAWVSRLLGRNLSQRWDRPRTAGVVVREVTSMEDMVRYASLIRFQILAQRATHQSTTSSSSALEKWSPRVSWCTYPAALATCRTCSPNQSTAGKAFAP